MYWPPPRRSAHDAELNGVSIRPSAALRGQTIPVRMIDHRVPCSSAACASRSQRDDVGQEVVPGQAAPSTALVAARAVVAGRRHGHAMRRAAGRTLRARRLRVPSSRESRIRFLASSVPALVDALAGQVNDGVGVGERLGGRRLDSGSGQA